MNPVSVPAAYIWRTGACPRSNFAADSAAPRFVPYKRTGGIMRFLTRWLIDWPESIARHFAWLGPLVARVTVGWVFMITGWGKLNNLPQVIENFAGWGIPFAEIMTPFVSAVEFGGG